ncbi:SRPBCC domain-containing protein [Arthrobacter sp. Br18]|uniref:SRPBCC domain-containing protein n=1 Tax=Arthrobacter sp. Br18 TaxID=1312954 RepID=UPI0004BA17B0|nr:SRPBCC domain-containing protein [Arthrobacter sp. Br18]
MTSETSEPAVPTEPSVSKRIDDDGATVLTIEYPFAFPPAKLWKHLTEPDKLKYWFPCEMDIQPRKDTEVSFTYADQRPLHGTVLEAEKPSLLAFTWEKETLRWELNRAENNGCRLVLSIIAGNPAHLGTMAAGWHLTLSGLDDFLSERDLGQDPALWQIYVDRYRAQFAD